jgi:hypothetical protein
MNVRDERIRQERKRTKQQSCLYENLHKDREFTEILDEQLAVQADKWAMKMTQEFILV